MISVSLDGAKDAIDVVREIIVPWQRRNARLKAKLENTLKQAEIQRINAEISIAKVKADRERAAAEGDKEQLKLATAQLRKTEAETSLLLAQSNKLVVEAEKERSILRQSQIEMAIRIIDKYTSNLSGPQKIDYIIRLLPIFEQMTNCDVELSANSSTQNNKAG